MKKTKAKASKERHFFAKEFLNNVLFYIFRNEEKLIFLNKFLKEKFCDKNMFGAA